MATHLHMRSSYSLLQSTLSIPRLVSLVKQRGFSTCAITENGVVFSAKAFEKACKKEGIKPIFGMEVQSEDDRFILLAKNEQGYLDLCKLASTGSTYSLDAIVDASHHCVVIQFSEQGYLESFMIQDDWGECQKHIIEMNRLFRDYVVGISMMQSSLFKAKNEQLINLCEELNLSCVALPKVYYGDEKEQDAYRMLQAIDKGVFFDNTTLINQPYRHILTSQEMESLYGSQLSLVSDEIDARCNVDLSKISTSLPIYENNANVASAVYLKQLCFAGLNKRFNNKPVLESYQKRLQYELDVIINMHYEDYFLIVYDFILYATKQGIYVGPGRGSAAGSLVSYCLGITHVDPIEYDLYFERFLNPERTSMPDIDVDFPDNRRDEVIEYVTSKYGRQHIAHIITFGTLAQRQVIRDVAKALKVSSITTDKLLKSIVKRLNATLSDSLKESKSLQYLIKEDKDAKRVIEMALQIEGLPRNKGTHAAGIVMSQKPLVEVLPTTQLDNSNQLTTQFTMDHLEEMGLVKMDFLGLRNLTIISDVVDEIKRSNQEFNILKISLKDKKTFELIRQAHTLGIFQMESAGMKQLVKEVEPTQFMDIADTIALYRPGPMQFRGQYVQNKRQPQKLSLIHEDLKDLVTQTHGVLIYQEQIMALAQRFAGFSLAKADLLRRAMSKKKASEMEKLKDDFIQGCVNNGYDLKIGQQLYDYVDRFAAYGFNRSHSVAYALVAYQMAYLKANYPLYFYKALLSSVMGSQTKLKEYIDECRLRGIKLLRPSVNYSLNQFSLEGDAIRLPLSIINSLGHQSVLRIIKVRDQIGKYDSFIDFVAYGSASGINYAQFKSLIFAGACDDFGYNRSTLIASLDDCLAYAGLIRIDAKSVKKDASLTQNVLDFGLVNEPIMTVMKENRLHFSQNEKDVLGFYFEYHPLLDIKRQLPLDGCVTLMQAYQQLNKTKTIAMVVSFKEIRSKKGDLMAFVTLEDELDQVEAIVFGNVWNKIKEIIKVQKIYKVIGHGQKDRNYIIAEMQEIEW